MAKNLQRFICIFASGFIYLGLWIIARHYEGIFAFFMAKRVEKLAVCCNQKVQKRFGEYKHTRTPVDDPLLPAIVTGASSNHFLESQALLQNIHQVLFPRYGSLRIIYFDLGLDRKEREILEKFCNCDIRRFPFENYSSHIRTLKTFGWKPKIVLEMMIEFKFVMWLDASIRFKNSTNIIDDLLIKSFDPETPVFGMNGDLSIMERTYLYTFKYLDADPQKYINATEVQGGWTFARYSNFSFEKIIKPWSECGLKYGCMSKGEPAGHCPKPNRSVGQCHRYDQSVLGIILNEIYDFNESKFSFDPSPYIDIKRCNRIQYFPRSISKIA